MPNFQFYLPTKLTRIQDQAVDSREPILLTGVPGTGKTVVSIRRLQNAASSGKKGIIFTYGKLLRKTIEEKLENNRNMPVANMHKWIWDIQDKDDKKYLKYFLEEKNLSNAIRNIKEKGIYFDEILVDEGQDLSINTYKLLKELTPNLNISADDAQQINNRQEASNEEQILALFPNLKTISLDEIFRSAYELYRFAIQFVPYNANAHNQQLLERLKRRNSGADKPFIYLEADIDAMYKTIKDIIDENPMDNIGILLELVDEVDQFANALSKDYEISKYHNQDVVPSTLNNIIVTTFKSAKGVEFDYVIIPFLDKWASYTHNPNEYYVGVTRAKNQVHILAIDKIPSIMENFDEDTYELVDNRR